MRSLSRKLLVFVLSFSMLFTSMTFLSFAESNGNYTATPSKTTVEVGDEFTVVIDFNGANLKTVIGSLSFDKSVVEYKGYVGDPEEPTKAFLKNNSTKVPYIELDIGLNETTKSSFGWDNPGTSQRDLLSTDGFLTLTFKALKTGDAGFVLNENSDGDDGYKGNISMSDVTVTNPLTSISVTTQPTKKTYCVGETFDKTGMKVTAKYKNGDTAVLDDKDYTVSTAALKESDTSVEVSYKEGNVTKTTEVTGIKVNKHVYSVDTTKGTDGWTWTNFSGAKAYLKCSNCNDEQEVNNTSAITYETTKAATCTAAGETTYTAKVVYNGQTFTSTNKDTAHPEATGHKYVYTWDWAKDHSKATLTVTCSNKDCTHSETFADISSSANVTKDPTCTAAGETTYTVTKKHDGKDQTATYVDNTLPAALNHDYTDVKPTWEWDGYTKATATFKCTRYSQCKHAETADATDTAIKVAHTTPVSCTTDGLDTYTATVTFGGKQFTDTKTKTITHEGHKYSKTSTVTWEWDGYTKATATVKCDNCTHTEEASATGTAISSATTKNPGCTTAGEETYTAKVTVGGVEFTDSKTKAIDPTGHDYKPTWNWVWTSATSATATYDAECTKCHDKKSSQSATVSNYQKVEDATCTTAGKTKATATATVGGQQISDTNTTDKFPAKLGHKMTAHTANAATCTKAGNSAYWYCSQCEKYFSDAEGNTAIKENSWVINKLNHDYEGAIAAWVWDSDTEPTKATATIYCKRTGCDAYEASKLTATDSNLHYDLVEDSTCAKEGTGKYTATVTLNGKTYTDTKTVTIAKKNHDYEQGWTWKWTSATDVTASLGLKCKNCTDTKEQTTATIKSIKPGKAATCTEAGTTTATAEVTIGGATYKDTNTTDKFPAKLGHKMTAHTANAATCTKDGNSAYWYCSQCEKYFSDAEGNTAIKENSWVISKLNHKYGDTASWAWDSDTEPTKATATIYCNREGCDAYEDSKLTATDSKLDYEVVEDSTCAKEGTGKYTATVTLNGKTYTDTKTVTIAKKDHDYEQGWTWKWTSATDVTASLGLKCKNCTDTKEQTAATITSITPGKAATCTEAGTTTATAEVTIGGATYKDTNTTDKFPAKLGHKMDKTAAKAATCEKDGNTEYYYCSQCKKYFADEDGEQEIAENSWVIAKLGHKFTVESIDKENHKINLVCAHDSSHKKTEDYYEEDKRETKIETSKNIEVTQALEEAGYETQEQIVEALEEVVAKQAGFASAKKASVEVTLLVKIGDTWVVATPEIMPKEGITVTIPYPEGMDKTNEFTIVHMFGETMTGADGKYHEAGDIEVINNITKTNEGLQFTVYSLSPFEIAAVPGKTPGTNTGDSNNLILFTFMMLLAMAGVGVTAAKKKRD